MSTRDYRLVPPCISGTMSQERITYPPLVAHGPDNKGAIVVVVSYSFMFITIIFALLRTWSSYVHKRDLREDDIAFFLAVVSDFQHLISFYKLVTNFLRSPAADHSRDHSHGTGGPSRSRAAYQQRRRLQTCSVLQGTHTNT